MEPLELRHIGGKRYARYGYGIDEVALVPSLSTVDPEDIDLSVDVLFPDGKPLFPGEMPLFASAMDSAVGPQFCGVAHRFGVRAVLNLQGLFTRYEEPEEALRRIREAPRERATRVIQEVYQAPIQEKWIRARIREIRETEAPVYVSLTPALVEKYLPILQEEGVDALFVQSTVTSPRHRSQWGPVLDLKSVTERVSFPVVVGNCVTYEVAYALMEAGAAAILVGVGPGAACTTRQVTGVGVPQITATADCAMARDEFYRRTGRYVPIITDGGMRTGGDIAKVLCAGADFVMLGSVFAKAEESPGRGYHWGMATADPNLPRGTRVFVGGPYPLGVILHGPSDASDGSLNLLGALKSAMGLVGAQNLRELQQAELIIAPSVQMEGKFYQYG